MKTKTKLIKCSKCKEIIDQKAFVNGKIVCQSCYLKRKINGARGGRNIADYWRKWANY